MAGTIKSMDVALLHHLEAAAEADAQLPKHVAHELEQQGLVEVGDHSPGEVSLTAAGRERLRALQAERAQADDIVP